MAAHRLRTLGAWIRRPESIVAVCAVIVSTVAVAVAAYEARIQRQWQRAALWPHIQLNRSYFHVKPDSRSDSGEWMLTLNAENVGVGPARIRDFHVTVDGKPMATWSAAMRTLLGTTEQIAYGQSTIRGTIIPPQRTIQMFQYSKQPNAGRLYREMNRLDFEACFCSVFDECWTTTYKSGDAVQVDSCGVDNSSFIE
jgi:hypothetical protein